MAAKKIDWAEDIDGEILINDKDISEEVIYGQRYIAKITELAGENLVGTIVRKV